MAKYGNILTVYFPQPNQLTETQTILTAQKTSFRVYDNTFFVETNSLDHTRKVEEKLAATTLVYTFFHNRNCDGSFLKSSIGDVAIVTRMKKILFD